ncbi:hypothetical protein GCM10025867_49620 (plasmid) [Frondihabitans sucicola]|uniref:Uncharacterized protein n=1 Tax=Frondihabitans sucicola TaxID=1268041 RepID=A0ABN6Y6C6_9MICO|nr:hypothetical protein [Frondihabitans sucicola]BDZ52721.1 hypothetical protein GCM10025867_49620 [Frondihabitans sucicola]
MTTTTETTTPTVTAPRITATVYFQVWQNNYAVTVDQATFDATSLYEAMSVKDRAAIEDNRDSSDNIYLDAVERGLVAAWHDRPFYVDIADAIEEYLEAKAA